MNSLLSVAFWTALVVIFGGVASGILISVELGIMIGMILGIAGGVVGNIAVSILWSIIVTLTVSITRNSIRKYFAQKITIEYTFIKTLINRTVEGIIGGSIGILVGGIFGNITGVLLGGILGAVSGFTTENSKEDIQGILLLVILESIIGSTSAGFREGMVVSIAGGIILGMSIGENLALNIGLSIVYTFIIANVGILSSRSWTGILMAIVFVGSYFIGYYKLLQYPVEIVFSLKAYSASQKNPREVFNHLQTSPLYWNKVFLPLPGLKSTLRLAAQENSERALEAISFIVGENPGQIDAARAASLEIILRFMERCARLSDMAKFSEYLAKTIPPMTKLVDPRWITTFVRLNAISKNASLYYGLEDQQTKDDILEQIITQLKQTHPNFIGNNANLNKRLDRTLTEWLNLVQGELEAWQIEKVKVKTVEQVIAYLHTVVPEAMKDKILAFKAAVEEYYKQHFSEQLVLQGDNEIIYDKNRIQVVSASYYWQILYKFILAKELFLPEQVLEGIMSLLASSLFTTFFKAVPQAQQGLFISALLDVQYIFEYIPMPKQLPVIFYTSSQFSENNAIDLRHLMIKFGSQPRSALLLLFMEPDQLKNAIKLLNDNLRRVYAYNIIPVTHQDFSRIIGSKDPQKVFRQLILTNVDLTLVSPFVTSGPTSSSMFFGREHELRMITEHAHDTNYALVGGRRIGKTSILTRLRDILLPAAGFQIFFHDCGPTPSQDELIAYVTQRWLSKASTHQFTSFASVIHALPNDKPLVILFDEFDALIAPDRSVGYPLLNTLRAFANSGRCHFILSGEQELRSNMKDPTSPLYNFGNEMLIGCLKFHAVHELIVQPMQQLEIELINTSEIVQRIWDFTSGHPSIIQRFCQRLINRLELRQKLSLSIDDVEYIIMDSNFTQEDFLETYWERATPLERLCSLVMARDNSLNTLMPIYEALTKLEIEITLNEVNDALTRLIDLRNILQRMPEGYYKFAVTAFPEVIARTNHRNELIVLACEDYKRAAYMK